MTRDEAKIDRAEQALMSMMQGEFSSLTISFNDHASSYTDVAHHLAEMTPDDEPAWVTPESRARAIATNRMWILQWYERTPVGFELVAAATLVELLTWVIEESRP